MPKNETTPTPENPKVTVIEEDINVQDTKDYCIGIDCHKLFIMVCVRTKSDGIFTATTARFDTDWDSLLRAKEWCIEVLRTKSNPRIDTSKPLHYVIESTATYHQPILLAWGGTPSVINPTLAGATKRKTDRLDAKLLALHDQTAVWRESFIVPAEVEALRLMISERDRFVSEARAASNRINNAMTRFGLNLGREGSVTKDRDVRALVENQVSDSPDDLPGICPIKMPMEARLVIREEYQKYDYLVSRAEEWKYQIVQKAYSMDWEISSGTTVSGGEVIPMLMTAPQIGELTAIIWLANVVTPVRFPNDRALAAYCGLDPSLKVSADHVTSTTRRGGCKALHKLLCSSADRLIRNHTEMLGQWGYRLYNQTGKWKKASNAVGRKLAIALYHMCLTRRDFSYENYRMAAQASSFNIPVEELPVLQPEFKRYIRILKEHGINTTSELVIAYLSCSLGSYRGLGRKFSGLLREFTNNQNMYRRKYLELNPQSDNTTTTEEQNEPTQ